MEAEVVISGNVGSEVEWRSDERYGARATFPVAATRRGLRDGVWVDLDTTWYRVTCWRQLAVHVIDSLKKGDAVIVSGRLRTDRWVGNDGIARVAFAVDATWVAPDLRRGTAAFTRARLRPEPTGPIETESEAARADADAARYDAEVRGTEHDPWAGEPDADGVIGDVASRGSVPQASDAERADLRDEVRMAS